MMRKDKALIFDLSSSISYGRLSWRGKILWPMLLTKSDDQGRGLAAPDRIKWKICPNVEELTIENAGEVLEEMASDRIGLLHLYHDDRGRPLYQIIRWWEGEVGSGSCLQFARRSEYQAPEGWTDRIRIQHGRGQHEMVNWDQPGGFVNGQPASTPPSQPASTPPMAIKEDNRTELNSTQDNNGTANAAPPSSPEKKPQRDPLTAGQRGFLDLFGAKRFRTVAQRDKVLALEREHGTTKLLDAANWAAIKGMPVGDAVLAVAKALPSWGDKPKHKSRGDPPRHRQLQEVDTWAE